MSSMNLLLKKILLMFLISLAIFAFNEFFFRYFDLDKELLDSISKWSFWSISFFIAMFVFNEKNRFRPNS